MEPRFCLKPAFLDALRLPRPSITLYEFDKG